MREATDSRVERTSVNVAKHIPTDSKGEIQFKRGQKDRARDSIASRFVRAFVRAFVRPTALTACMPMQYLHTAQMPLAFCCLLWPPFRLLFSSFRHFHNFRATALFPVSLSHILSHLLSQSQDPWQSASPRGPGGRLDVQTQLHSASRP